MLLLPHPRAARGLSIGYHPSPPPLFFRATVAVVCLIGSRAATKARNGRNTAGRRTMKIAKFMVWLHDVDILVDARPEYVAKVEGGHVVLGRVIV